MSRLADLLADPRAPGLARLDFDVKDWAPTAQGKNLCDWVETGKRHHSGAPITMLRWREQATLEILKDQSIDLDDTRSCA